ncbi:hypothetical protein NHQ30_000443 [Ciborinia camelliae]|nr:hypothetical protein NHQ30_000443 [Ciborinia camelliae]
MSSMKNTKTPSSKDASIDNNQASIEKTPVENSEASADITSSNDTMVASMEPLSSFNRKRRSTANSAHGSGDEKSDNQSTGSSKRRKIQRDNNVPTPHPSSPRKLANYKGMGLTSGRLGVAVKKDNPIEKHVYLDPNDTTDFSAIAAEKADKSTMAPSTSTPVAAEPSTPNASSSPANGEDNGASDLTSPKSKAQYFSLEKSEALAQHFTVDRLAYLNDMIREIVNTREDDNKSMVLSRDIADLLLYKDHLINEANNQISTLDEGFEETLEQLFFSNDAKSDLIDKARAETNRVKAELAVFTNLEAEKKRFVDRWRAQDIIWDLRSGNQQKMIYLEGQQAYWTKNSKMWEGAFRKVQKEHLELVAVHEGTLKEVTALKEENRLARLDVTQSSEYKELLEKFNAAQRELATPNGTILQEAAAAKEESRRLRGRVEHFSECHKKNVETVNTLKQKYDHQKDLLTTTSRRNQELQARCEELEKQCENTRTQLIAQVEQGTQWVENMVNSCPFPIPRLIKAETGRAQAEELRRIEEQKCKLLAQSNEYLKERLQSAQIAGSFRQDLIPSIEVDDPFQADTEPQVPSGHTRSITRSLSPASKEIVYGEAQAVRASPNAYFNTAFYGRPGNTQMGDGYHGYVDNYRESPPRREPTSRPETPVSSPNELSPLYDGGLAISIMADIQKQEEQRQATDRQSSLEDLKPKNGHNNDQNGEDSDDNYSPPPAAGNLVASAPQQACPHDEIRDGTCQDCGAELSYQDLVNNEDYSDSPAIKEEEDSEPFFPQYCPHEWVVDGEYRACQLCGEQDLVEDFSDYESDEESSESGVSCSHSRVFGGKCNGSDCYCHRNTAPEPLNNDPPIIDDDDDRTPPPGGCYHRTVFADGTCGQCGRKLPQPPVNNHRFREPSPDIPQDCRHTLQYDGMCGQCGASLAAPVAVPLAAPRLARLAPLAAPVAVPLAAPRLARLARLAPLAAPVAVPLAAPRLARLAPLAAPVAVPLAAPRLARLARLAHLAAPRLAPLAAPVAVPLAAPRLARLAPLAAPVAVPLAAPRLARLARLAHLAAPRLAPLAAPLNPVRLTSSPSPPPSKKRGRFSDDSDSDPFYRDFRPFKKVKSVATPAVQSSSSVSAFAVQGAPAVVAPSEDGPSVAASPAGHTHSDVNSHGNPQGETDAEKEIVDDAENDGDVEDANDEEDLAVQVNL